MRFLISSSLLLLAIAPTIFAAPAPKTRSSFASDSPNPYLSSKTIHKTKYYPQEFWYSGQRGWCYLFWGDNGRVNTGQDGLSDFTLTNTVLIPRYADGTYAGDPIFSVIPTDYGYSDAWIAQFIYLPPTVRKNSHKDYNAILAKGWQVSTIGLLNWPLVPKGSQLMTWVQPPFALSDEPKSAWYKGHRVYYFNFGFIPVDVSSTLVPTATLVTPFVNSVALNSSVQAGYFVTDAVPGTPKYTGFFAVDSYLLPDGVAENTIRDISNVNRTSPNFFKQPIIANCPVFYFENSTFTGSLPDQPPVNLFTLPPVPSKPPSKETASVYWNGPGAVITNTAAVFNSSAIVCWPFGTRSSRNGFDQSHVRINRVLLPVYTTKDYNGVYRSAGKPVFQYIPGDDGYSDAVVAVYINVADNEPLDKFTTYAKLNDPAVMVNAGVHNWPVVPFGSQLAADNNYKKASIKIPVPKLTSGWYKGKLINFFDAGVIFSAAPPALTTSYAVVNSDNQIVVQTVATQTGYTGFYSTGKLKGVSHATKFEDFDLSGILFNTGIYNCPTAAFV